GAARRDRRRRARPHRRRALLRRERRDRRRRPRRQRHRRGGRDRARRSVRVSRMSDLVLVTDDGPVRTVRLNRPEKKNALTLAMYAALVDALASAGASPQVRCVVIAGAPGAFCAGNDLKDFLDASANAEGLAPQLIGFLHALARAE